jgi:hypothetical protein
METRKYCAYNLSRESSLSSKLTVADSANQPLKVLKVMIGGLALDAESGLWLKPVIGVPDVPRLFPFDLVYLDGENRVIRGVEVLPGVDFPPFSRQVTSALVLPIQTISLTQTRPGDRLVICSEEEMDHLLQSINENADTASLEQDHVPQIPQQNQVTTKSQNGSSPNGNHFEHHPLSSAPISQSTHAEISRSLDISDLFPFASVAQRSGQVVNDFQDRERKVATGPDPAPAAPYTESRPDNAVVQNLAAFAEDSESLHERQEPIALAAPEQLTASAAVPLEERLPTKGVSRIGAQQNLDPKLPDPLPPARPAPHSLFVRRVESLVVEAMNARSIPAAPVPFTEHNRLALEPLQSSPAPVPVISGPVVESVQPIAAECEQLPAAPVVSEPASRSAEPILEESRLSAASVPGAAAVTETSTDTVEEMQKTPEPISEPATQTAVAIMRKSRRETVSIPAAAASVPKIATSAVEEIQKTPLPLSEPVAKIAEPVMETTEQPKSKASAMADATTKSPKTPSPNQPSHVVSASNTPSLVMKSMGSTVSQYQAWQVSTSTVRSPISASMEPAREVGENSRTSGPRAPLSDTQAVAQGKKSPESAEPLDVPAPLTATPAVSTPAQEESNILDNRKTESPSPAVSFNSPLPAPSKPVPYELSEEERAARAREAALAAARLKKEIALERLSNAQPPREASPEAGTIEKGPQRPQNARPSMQQPTMGAAAAQKQQAETPTKGDPQSDWESQVKAKDTLTSRLMRWFDPEVAPHDRRRASRHNVPGLVAYYFSGGAPKGHEIADISPTGFYMITKDRWMPETMIQMTLQKPGTSGKPRRDSLTVLTKIIRIGSNGVGAQFVIAEDLDPYSREILPMQATDRKALAKFL